MRRLPRTDRWAALLMSAVCLLLVSGCGTYRLGSMLPDSIQTIYIPTFVNQSGEPRIEADTTRAAIAEFQKDGSLDVVKTPEEADAILKVTLTRYEADPIVYDATRKTEATDYRLTLSAKLVLTAAKTDKVIAESPLVQGDALFQMIGDFTSSKAQALKPASVDLGHKIVESVVEAW
jgi:hypothetical protein